MNATVTVRCENDDCRKWFEPKQPPPAAEHPHLDTALPQHHVPTGNETVCPHCGTRQEVPIVE